MKTLVRMYHPITATPFQNDEYYCEIPPCDALKPYIRCFWGTRGTVETPGSSGEGLVIPDTCMDIILNADYTHGCGEASFCALVELVGGDLLQPQSMRGGSVRTHPLRHGQPAEAGS